MKSIISSSLLIFLSLFSQTSFGQFPIAFSPKSQQEDKETLKKTRGAAVIVLGESFTFHCWDYEIEEGMKQSGFNATNPCATFKDLQFTDQVKVFKAILFNKKNDKLRQSIIEDMYKEVFGRPSSTDEFIYWDQRLTSETTNWYATMVLENIKFLNTHPDYRSKAIEQVYMNVFGRMPDQGDMNYWKPRKEHYRLMYSANVSYLYSPTGVAELSKTIKRAYETKKPNHTDEEVKNMIIKARNNKYDYNQIVNAIK